MITAIAILADRIPLLRLGEDTPTFPGNVSVFIAPSLFPVLAMNCSFGVDLSVGVKHVACHFPSDGKDSLISIIQQAERRAEMCLEPVSWGIFFMKERLFHACPLHVLPWKTVPLLSGGGDVLIDPGGIVRLHHTGVGPADRPVIGQASPGRSARPESG
jgi:hypothetical protein